MLRKYDDEFLIEELHRFVRENGKVPIARDMSVENGYPSFNVYYAHFGTFNNALEIANLSLNKTWEYRTGFETCCKCGCSKEQTSQWYTKGLPKDKVMCQNCYQNPDYKNGRLNKESSTAKGTISEQIVKNVLNLEDRHDCNFACGFNYKVDLYHKDKYKSINVKDSYLHDDNAWHFTLNQKVTPDTYIMLGYDKNRKSILHVWISHSIDDLTYDEKNEKQKTSIGITNDVFTGLKRAEQWEVDNEPYNDMLHLMSQKRKETDGENCFLSNDDLGSN